MKKIISLLLLLSTFSAFSASPDQVRLINVMGTSERSFEPDMAFISLSVWGKGDTAQLAQKASAAQYELLKTVIEDAKVKAADIQSIGYELNPEYVYDQKSSQNKIVGFIATQNIRVTLRKIQIVGSFMDALNKENNRENRGEPKNLKASTNIQSVSFDLEKRKDIEKTLMSEAVKAAADEAQMLAKAAGVKIKQLFQLTPIAGYSYRPQFQADGLMMKSARGALGGAAEASTEVFAGEVKVSASVNAQYEIE